MNQTLRIALAAAVAAVAALTVTPGGSGELRLSQSAVARTQELTPCQQSCQAQYQADLAYCATIPGGTSYSIMLQRLCQQSADARLAQCYSNCTAVG